MSDYRPIDCDVHEQLELAVLQQRRLRLTLRNDVETVMPVDVQTADGAEWLRARRHDGSEIKVRLDEIRKVEAASPD